MEKKALLRLLVILLALSYVVFVAAVPATRSLVTKTVDADPSVQHHQAKEALKDSKNSEEVSVGMEEGGADDVADADYSEPKPNPAHQPKSPGKPKA